MENRGLDASTAARQAPSPGAAARLVPALTIAAHPDPARVGDRFVLARVAAGREELISRSAPAFLAAGRALGAPLSDRFVSRTPLRVEPVGDRLRLDPGGGPAIWVGDRETTTAVEVGPLAPRGGVPIVLGDRVVLVLHLVELDHDGAVDALGMIGRGLAVAQLRRSITQVADLDVPVLVRGETGSGKELVARALHDRSPRRHGPFVSINLAAVPRELASAELFGAVRGAYTGAARDREGYFRTARGGTLFLDEVGEAPPEVQAMLLRVLETGELYPVGGDTPVATDVRVIAATDADLDAQIREGRFKAPLLHRLAGHELYVPPLRERPEDVGLLFHHFAALERAAVGDPAIPAADPLGEPWLPAAIALRLVRFAWPGNIRQLRNVARQLVIASRGRAQLELPPRLGAELDAGAVAAAPSRAPGEAPADRAREPSRDPVHDAARVASARRRPAEVSEAELVAALRAHAWDLKAAADALGIPRASIYDVIARCPGVRTAGDLSAEEIARCHEACDGDLDRMSAQLEVSRRALGRRVKELGLDRGPAGPERPR